MWGKIYTTEIDTKITHLNDHVHQLISSVVYSTVNMHVYVRVSCPYIFYCSQHYRVAAD